MLMRQVFTVDLSNIFFCLRMLAHALIFNVFQYVNVTVQEYSI